MNANELRELDAWIAENVFGWCDRVEVAKGRSLKSCGEFYTAFKQFNFVCGDYSSHVTKDGAIVYCGEPFQFRRPPNYTADPAASRELEKKCIQKVGSFDRIHIQIDDGSYTVMTHTGEINESTMGLNQIWECAETLELAIALFAKHLFSRPVESTHDGK